MGNLPFARTKTYSSGDPLDSAIIDELQDQIVSIFPMVRGARPLVVPGARFELDAGTPTRAGNVWTFPSAGGPHTVSCGITLPVGGVISSILWSFNRNSSGTGDLSMSLVRRSFGDGGATSQAVTAGVRSSGTGWTTRDNTVDGNLPHTVLANTLYLLSFASSATPTSTPFFDGVIMTLDR